MAKKKGGGKKGGGKKGKKGPVDWGAQQMERYVEVEVRNSAWQSLRFTQMLPTSTKLVSAFLMLTKLSCSQHRRETPKCLLVYLISAVTVAVLSHSMLTTYLGEQR